MDYTQNYNLNLPEHGYSNWDVPNNENFEIIDSALTGKQDVLTAGTDLEIVQTAGESRTVTGTSPLVLLNAAANTLSSVIVYGACSQTGTPTTSSPVDILCNNGAIKYNTGTSAFYADGTVETITDNLNNSATAEMLLGMGDYVDTQNLLGNGGTRKVGLMVLTGTEEFNTTTLANCYSLASDLGTGNLIDRTVYCTHFNHASTLPASGSRQGYALIGNKTTPSNSYTVGFGATVEFSTVNLFKAWLAEQYSNGTPVIIAYPLTSPTTFATSAQTLNTKDGINQLTIMQSSISGLRLKATYITDSSSTINFTNDSGYITDITSDNKSITKNLSNEIQTVGVIDQNNTSNAIKTWTGTRVQYEAILNKDATTLYTITDDTDATLSVIEALYPVGSIYITTANSCPLANIISGSTWVLVSAGMVLQGADGNHAAGTTISAGLPNITGSVLFDSNSSNQFIPTDAFNGCLYGTETATKSNYLSTATTGGSNKERARQLNVDASRSNPIYGNSNTVQPPAFAVNIYRRTA